MTVTAGPAPVFNWTPLCGIAYLVVEDRGDGQGYWTISGPVGTNQLAPPITYGVVPDGATQDIGLIPLEQGGAYLVRVFLVDRDQNGDFTTTQAGEAPFNM